MRLILPLILVLSACEMPFSTDCNPDESLYEGTYWTPVLDMDGLPVAPDDASQPELVQDSFWTLSLENNYSCLSEPQAVSYDYGLFSVVEDTRALSMTRTIGVGPEGEVATSEDYAIYSEALPLDVDFDLSVSLNAEDLQVFLSLNRVDTVVGRNGSYHPDFVVAIDELVLGSGDPLFFEFTGTADGFLGGDPTDGEVLDVCEISAVGRFLPVQMTRSEGALFRVCETNVP